MRKRLYRWSIGLVLAAASGWVFQTGCIRTLQREIEILVRPEASLGLIYDSKLVDLFGPGILNFW